MDAGLAVACFSLVLTAGSIGWQMATRHLDGGRVRLRLVHGVVGSGGVVSGPVGRDGTRRRIVSLRQQGYTGPEMLGVTVTNVGRAPVRIDSYSVRLVDGGGFAVTPVAEAIGPQLPHRLEPGESETWFTEIEKAQMLVDAVRSIGESVRDVVVMTVKLGTGDEKATRRRIAVGAPS